VGKPFVTFRFFFEEKNFPWANRGYLSFCAYYTRKAKRGMLWWLGGGLLGSRITAKRWFPTFSFFFVLLKGIVAQTSWSGVYYSTYFARGNKRGTTFMKFGLKDWISRLFCDISFFLYSWGEKWRNLLQISFFVCTPEGNSGENFPLNNGPQTSWSLLRTWQQRGITFVKARLKAWLSKFCSRNFTFCVSVIV